MTYEQLKALGIDIGRGQLAAGFEPDQVIQHFHQWTEPDYDRNAPRRADRESGEDLSHLNPQRRKARAPAAAWMRRYTREELSAEMRRRAKARDPRATTTRPWDKR